MTGSGTLLDPYIIETLDDLQAVRDDPDKYYELGTDIDASPTIGWFGGLGFEPLNWGGIQKRRPTGDHSSTGSWTVFPADPTTKYDKVDEQDCDEDATYIRTDAAGGTVLFAFPNFSIPIGATGIAVYVRLVARDEGGAGTATYNTYIRVNGTDYQVGSHGIGLNPTYRFINLVGYFSTNPDTGAAWTVDDINGVGPNPLQAFGVKVSGKIQRISQMYAVVGYSPPVLLTFDGKGHTIRNLYINRVGGRLTEFAEDNCALFGSASDGQVKNVNLTDVDITGNDQCAGIAGWAYGYAGLEAGISDCHVTGIITATGHGAGGVVGMAWELAEGIVDCSFDGTIDCAGLAGGIVGEVYRIVIVSQTNIRSCVSSGLITGSVTKPADAGGIAGAAVDSDIHDCHSSMVIDAENTAGGIVGEYYPVILPALSVSIERCHFTGSITAVDDDVGGIVGLGYDAIISECYSTGNIVAGGENIGGLIGQNGCWIHDCYARGDVTGFDYVAGFTGAHWDFAIERCYSTGRVRCITEETWPGFGTVGGFAVDVTEPISDCFWDMNTSGQATSAGGTGKTTAQMKAPLTFTVAGWDFISTWAFSEVQTTAASNIGAASAVLNGNLVFEAFNDNYPCLQIFPISPSTCYYEWGQSPTLGNTTALQSKSRGESFLTPLSGLLPGRTYYYRAAARNPTWVYGSVLSFTTPAGMITVLTLPATNILRYCATLNGVLTDGGGSVCSVGFEWGTDPSSLSPPLIVGAGVSPLPFSVTLCSLIPGTTYYFRAYAINIAGTGRGVVNSFTTEDVLPPIVPKLPPTRPTLDYINIGIVIAGSAGLALILTGEDKLTKAIYNVLAKRGVAMSPAQITDAVKQDYPQLHPSIEDVLAILRKRRDLFQEVRTGMYFLAGKVEGRSYPLM